jgi:hypothetical protein
MKRFIVILMICGFLTTGCAGVGHWSPGAQSKLDAFGVWADMWVGGALKVAPVLISAAAAFVGMNATQVTMANQAVVAAQATLGTYHAVVAAGSGDEATAQAAVITAINQVKTTMTDVQAIIDTGKGGTGPAPSIAPVPSIAPAPVGALK